MVVNKQQRCLDVLAGKVLPVLPVKPSLQRPVGGVSTLLKGEIWMLVGPRDEAMISQRQDCPVVQKTDGRMS